MQNLLLEMVPGFLMYTRGVLYIRNSNRLETSSLVTTGSAQELGHLAGGIGEDDVGAGTADGGEMLEHAPAQAQPPKQWAHIHALDFPVCCAKELDTTASGSDAIMACDEKRHLLFK